MTDTGFNKKELLKPINMLNLYAQGAFPMADEEGEIDWYQPKTRTIIPLHNYNIPRSLKKFMRACDFNYSYNERTIDVVKNCADRKETWISNELIEAYIRLEEIGFLHSVEVYSRSKLIGGLFGVAIGGAFFGESMFTRISQASKAALVKLIERLKEKNFVILDVQFTNPHLEMFGSVEINFKEYNDMLALAYDREVSFL